MAATCLNWEGKWADPGDRTIGSRGERKKKRIRRRGEQQIWSQEPFVGKPKKKGPATNTARFGGVGETMWIRGGGHGKKKQTEGGSKRGLLHQVVRGKKKKGDEQGAPPAPNLKTIAFRSRKAVVNFPNMGKKGQTFPQKCIRKKKENRRRMGIVKVRNEHRSRKNSSALPERRYLGPGER